jgi:flagellar motor switch protein FliM
MLTETSSRKSRNKELKALLGGAKVNLEAIIGNANLTMNEIINLEIGDIIRLDRNADDTVILRVDGKDKFKGNVGIHRYRKSVKVVEVLRTEQDEVKDILSEIEEDRKNRINLISEEEEKRLEEEENGE